MSTRSRIGIEEAAGGKIRSIYCHFDGYPEGGVGTTLFEHYTDEQKIRDLIALGDISSLGKEIGVPHKFPGDAPLDWNYHNAIQEAGWTTAYHRDRREDLHISESGSRKEFLAIDTGEEYYYLWSCKNKCWNWCPHGDTKMRKLTKKTVGKKERNIKEI
jgi:hypothetical protein